MSEKPAMTSSELGTLWMTYQQKTMAARMLDYFIEQAEDAEARRLLIELQGRVEAYVERIGSLFREEGAVLPEGFTSEDVNKNAPRLYDNGFDIHFFRLFEEIAMGMHALNIGMAYREDIMSIFKELTEIAQSVYASSTRYLTEKGLIVRSPYVTMPQRVTFVKDTDYLSGLLPFTKKRTLNVVEVAHMYHAIESNVTGMQMITGFAQTAQSDEVRNYFSEGLRLAKSIIDDLRDTLAKSDIVVPASPNGSVTRSTVPPFSDKLMMYCVSLLNSFSIGGNSLGTAFSMRNDLPAKMIGFTKDIFEYAHEGAKIMIRNGWLEEPPQMEERKELIHS